MYKLKPFVSEFKDAKKFNGSEESYQAIAEWMQSEGEQNRAVHSVTRDATYLKACVRLLIFF